MRGPLLLVWLPALLVLLQCAGQTAAPAPETTPPAAAPTAAAPTASNPAVVSFDTQVRPILERCRPCHFEGGKIYAKLPFDRPETIRTLGTKLFTRIKDEKDQAAIRAFLEQSG